jgi:hypothetical protein
MLNTGCLRQTCEPHLSSALRTLDRVLEAVEEVIIHKDDSH